MTELTDHYGSQSLTQRILDALAAAGIELEAHGPGALAGVDEFHLGGHRATREVIAALDPGQGSVVVDIGCGIGGAARQLAASGAHVHGIDLTPEFVATATELTALVGLSDRVDFRVASGTDLPFDDALAAVVSACRARGITAGIHATPKLAARRIEQGFRMVTATSDLLSLRAGAVDGLKMARNTGADGPGDAMY